MDLVPGEPRSPPQLCSLPQPPAASSFPLLSVVHSPTWSPGLAEAGKGRYVWSRREKGGSKVLLENKLHPFSIFIRREGSEQSSVTRCVARPGVCEWRGPFSLLRVFVSVLVLFKQHFISLFILSFLFLFCNKN